MIKKVCGLATALTLSIMPSYSVANAESSKEIIVSAAADLTRAFKEIGEMYEKETGYKTVFNFGSSGLLAQQIEGGAPVDLFAAANKSYIDNLEKKGFVIPETKRIYAIGRIVLVAPRGSVKINSLQDLIRPEINKIAIAAPSHAPYGMAAKEAMGNAGVWERVKDKLVYGENIRQVLQYVETGNVDAAVVALALCIGGELEYSIIPQELYMPMEQSMAIIKGAKNEKKARELADYINGPKGRTVLGKYGFGLK